MGQRTRQHDWSATTLGTPDQWPLSLRTTIGTVLHSAFPMFLWWGPDLLCFYNDAYRVSLGENGKHPAVGKRGAEVWPEIWDFIGPLIEQVMRTGEPVFYEDQLVPIYRNGRLEDVYWTFSYSPAYGDEGQINGVFVTCTETTAAVVSSQQLKASESRFRSIVEQAPMAIGLFSGRNMVIEVGNNRIFEVWDKDPSVIGMPVIDALPEIKGQGYIELLEGVYDTGVPFAGNNLLVKLNRQHKLEDVYFDLLYTPLHDATNTITGIMVLANEVTERVLSQQALRESEARFQAAIAAVEGILWTNNALGEMEGLQPGWASLTGQTYEQYQGYGWASAVHPDDTQPTIDAWQEAVRERRTFVFEHRVRQHNGTWGRFTIRAVPLLNADGTIREWVGVHTDITGQNEAVLALAQSEARFRTLIEEAPVATCLYVGREMRIEVANELMIKFFGRGRSILNQPIRSVLSATDGGHTLRLLEQVFATGEAYNATGAPANLTIEGVTGTYYFDLTLKPLRNEVGAVYAILQTAIDVSEQVLARRKVEAAQADLFQTNQRLTLALDAGQLGSYELELETGLMICTPQCKANYGQTPDAVFNFPDLLNIIVPDDRDRVQQAVAHAVETRTTYHAEYQVWWPDGTPHWLKASGQPIYQLDGQPIKIVGVTQDITVQRMAREDLEQQVQKRTEELAATNEELSATNEELAASNEETVAANNELSAINSLLSRSNSNLEKFAYVASHDLQEPLRKIQAFGDLLKSQYASQLGDGVAHLERMQAAANRMSTLIRDLLTYSRIATQQERIDTVPLTDVLTTVLTDLDLRIQETEATVSFTEDLPAIQGDRSQLEQLFQNLLSNALKFRRADVKPVIRIAYRLAFQNELPPTVKPVRTAALYHCIEIIDNGIGFDEKYVDRIFQVFQRLSGRNQYAGTGIGLAICEKVAANHGGAITASSQPGAGATFTLYLPTDRPVKRHFTR